MCQICYEQNSVTQVGMGEPLVLDSALNDVYHTGLRAAFYLVCVCIAWHIPALHKGHTSLEQGGIASQNPSWLHATQESRPEFTLTKRLLHAPPLHPQPTSSHFFFHQTLKDLQI